MCIRDSLCTSQDMTYKFIDDVIRELAAITPGPYIHIGGDESHATKREDYIPFINKVEDIVISHGKQILGWDDIAVASLKTNIVAQHWANICLLYTSDAADEEDSVDLGGR